MRLETWAKRYGATVYAVKNPVQRRGERRKAYVTVPLLTDVSGLFELTDYSGVAYHINLERSSTKQYGGLRNGKLRFVLVAN
jgi:hypothetical protein